MAAQTQTERAKVGSKRRRIATDIFPDGHPPYLAEFIATMVFVILSLLSTMGGLGGVEAVNGFTIFVMVAATAKPSGGHINPAVTFAVMIRGLVCKDFCFMRGIGYILAQLSGAVTGASILYGLSFFIDGGKDVANTLNLGTPALADRLSPWGGFLFEMIFGFVLVFVVLCTAVEQKHSWAPFAIGMTVFVLALAGGSLTGAAMNPARWFGPAMVSGTWDNAWIYVFAPLVGAIIAVIVNGLISSATKTSSPQ